MTRSEIRGTSRAAYTALLRARQALLDGIEDDEVMLTPHDMDELFHTAKDAQVVLTDIKRIEAKFGAVAQVRRDISPVSV